MTIRIVSEGVSDNETLSCILQSFTGNKDLDASRLFPQDSLRPGGKDNVVDYCKTDEFKGAFGFADFVVVQLDTDWLQMEGTRRDWIIPQIEQKTPEEIVTLVREKLIAEIGTDFYTSHAHQIIFAIAVDEIECWFLGIYFDKKKAAKTTGCTDLLNTVLPQREGFFIKEKPVENYRKMCKHFKKKADLEKHSQHNPSFRLFLEELQAKLADQTSAQPA